MPVIKVYYKYCKSLYYELKTFTYLFLDTNKSNTYQLYIHILTYLFPSLILVYQLAGNVIQAASMMPV